MSSKDKKTKPIEQKCFEYDRIGYFIAKCANKKKKNWEGL